MLTLRQSDVQRYWEKVDVRGGDECWPWIGCKSKKGYGLFSVSRNGRDTNHNAHRIGLAIKTGRLPDDAHALHTCIGHPWCQNPKHLYAGTNLQNIADKMRQGRHRGARGERCRAHKLVTAQVLEIRALYRTGQYRQKDLAKAYGVHQQQISRIVTRKRWEHLR